MSYWKDIIRIKFLDARNQRHIPASHGQYLVNLIRIAEENQLKDYNATLGTTHIEFNYPISTAQNTSFDRMRAQHGFEAGVMNWLNDLGFPIKFEYRIPYPGYRELVLNLSKMEPIK